MVFLAISDKMRWLCLISGRFLLVFRSSGAYEIYFLRKCKRYNERVFHKLHFVSALVERFAN